MNIIRITLFLVLIFFVIAVILFFRAMQLPSRIKRAEEHLEEGEHSKANAIVKRVLEKKKDYAPARYLKAKILIVQKQFISAISELNGVLSIPEFQKHVNELEVHYRLAELYNETQQYQKEIEEYRAILKFNPEDTNANHRMGHSLYRQKKYREAKDHLVKAYSSNSALIDVLIPIGVSNYFAGEFNDAEQYLIKAIEMSQDPIEANFYLGNIYKGKKDFDAAIKMFETSKRDSRFFVQSLFRLGEIYFENELYSDAIKVLEEGIGRLKGSDDESLSYRYLLSECYETENMIKEAVHHWEQIEKSNPNYRNVKSKLEEFKKILNDENLSTVFTSSLDELQPLISEIISRMNYNIVSKKEISHNEYVYRAYNIKRTNEPPILIYFNRTTKEINEGQILNFQKRVTDEKCKSGIYLTTAKFSIRAKSASASRSIELFDYSFLIKTIEKIKTKFKKG